MGEADSCRLNCYGAHLSRMAEPPLFWREPAGSITSADTESVIPAIPCQPHNALLFSTATCNTFVLPLDLCASASQWTNGEPTTVPGYPSTMTDINSTPLKRAHCTGLLNSPFAFLGFDCKASMMRLSNLLP